MAWTTMHFAAGMMGGGALTGIACLIVRRGWRWLPAAMTVGGVWGLIPDLPRIFREDFTGLPLSGLLGSPGLERWLHHIGNLFFFHHALDAQPKEFALLGVAIILMLYNASIAMLMVMERLQRNSLANRAFAAHGAKVFSRGRSSRRHRSHSHGSHHEGSRSHAAAATTAPDRVRLDRPATSHRTPAFASTGGVNDACPDIVARIGDHTEPRPAVR